MICSKLLACSFWGRNNGCFIKKNGHIFYLQLETDRFEWSARMQEDSCHGQLCFCKSKEDSRSAALYRPGCFFNVEASRTSYYLAL